mgnify:CR=1 FL=1
MSLPKSVGNVPAEAPLVANIAAAKIVVAIFFNVPSPRVKVLCLCVLG